MIKTNLALAFASLIAATPFNVKRDMTVFQEGAYVTFRADTGKFLARCYGCIPGATSLENAFVHVTDPSQAPWSKWIVRKMNNGKFAFQSDDGNYLARCYNCVPGGAYPDVAFVHISNPADAPWAQWEVIDMGNLKVALKSDNGNYLARCNNCVPGGTDPDAAFVHVSDPFNSPWAQWDAAM